MCSSNAFRIVLAALAALSAAACDGPGRDIPADIAQCQNGTQDGAESAIDCGGGCTPCVEGARCNVADDCASGTCDAGRCGAAPSCTDGAMNGHETGIDCGGGCPGCPAGGGCTTATDCLGGVCDGGTCGEAMSCTDAALSPGETDVDCGGACSPCPTDKNCKVAGDCLWVRLFCYDGGWTRRRWRGACVSAARGTRSPVYLDA